MCQQVRGIIMDRQTLTAMHFPCDPIIREAAAEVKDSRRREQLDKIVKNLLGNHKTKAIATPAKELITP